MAICYIFPIFCFQASDSIENNIVREGDMTEYSYKGKPMDTFFEESAECCRGERLVCYSAAGPGIFDVKHFRDYRYRHF